MKRSLSVLAMATSLVLAAPLAHATMITYYADLSGPNESPPNASPATGSATVTVDDVLDTMRVVAIFSGLTGTTSAAHIHCCTAAPLIGAVGVATTTPTFTGFPPGVTSGAYDMTFDMSLASSYNPAFVTAHGGVAGAQDFLFAGMAGGKSYFNLHTTAFPGGEIRGFLTRALPEPLSLALVGVGLVGLGFSRRKTA